MQPVPAIIHHTYPDEDVWDITTVSGLLIELEFRALPLAKQKPIRAVSGRRWNTVDLALISLGVQWR